MKKPDFTLVVFRDVHNEWRWHTVARNGKITGHGEGYKRRGTMLRTLARMFAGSQIGQQVAGLQAVKK